MTHQYLTMNNQPKALGVTEIFQVPREAFTGLTPVEGAWSRGQARFYEMRGTGAIVVGKLRYFSRLRFERKKDFDGEKALPNPKILGNNAKALWFAAMVTPTGIEPVFSP